MKNPFAVPNQPIALEWDEWDKWHEEAKKKYPVRHFLSWEFSIWCSRTWRRFIHEPWYYTKCALWHRYNVVKVRTLPPTWVDRNEILLHAMFQILTDFVEMEKPYGLEPGADDPIHKEEWEQIRGLYDWWKKERPARPDYIDVVINDGATPENYKKAGEIEQAYDEEDTAKLKRLVELRGMLWT